MNPVQVRSISQPIFFVGNCKQKFVKFVQNFERTHYQWSNTALKITLFIPRLMISLCDFFISQLKKHTLFSKEIYSHRLPVAEKLKKQLEFAKKQQALEQPKNFDITKVEIPSKDLDNTSKYGIAFTQGKRSTMEDEHLIQNITVKCGGIKHSIQLFGIFDGHAGRKTATLVAKEFGPLFKKLLEKAGKLTEETVTNSLTRTFDILRKMCVCTDETTIEGTTATCAVKIDNVIYIPNVGDSRTILVTTTETVQLTEDAKPDQERFAKAILKAGGAIFRFFGQGVARVNGLLAVARDIGNYEHMCPRPKMTRIEAISNQYLVLACDGLWDVATTDEVGEAIRIMEREGLSSQQMAQRLVDSALSHGSTDNISVLVVKL